MKIDLRRHFSTLFTYLFFGFIILGHYTIWLRADIFSSRTVTILAFGFAICIILLNTPKILQLFVSEILYIVLIIAGFSFYILFHSSTFSSVAFDFLLPAILFSLLGIMIRRQSLHYAFWKCFVNLVCVIAAVSLFFFFLGSFLGIVHPNGTITFDWGTVRTCSSYYGLYYEPQKITFLFYTGIRNCGIFCEAPMYNYILCIAWFIQILYLQDSKIKSFILMFTIFTTFSTTGIVLVVMFYGLQFFSSKRNKRLLAKIKFLLRPIIMVAAALIIVWLIRRKQIEGSLSYGIRLDQILACIKVFFDTKFLGCGYGNRDAIYSVVNTSVLGMSAGIPYLLAFGGIGLGAMFAIPTINYLVHSIKEKNNSCIIFTIGFLYLNFMTIVVTAPITWLIIGEVFAVYRLEKEYYYTKNGSKAEYACLEDTKIYQRKLN